MAHPRTIVASLVVAALATGGSPARGQTSWQALGTLTTGATNDAVPGAEGDGADSYTELSPALRLGLRSGRAIHQLQYTFAATIYAANFDEASSYNNTVAYSALVQASDNLRLGLGVFGRQGQQNAQAAAEILAEGVQDQGAVSFIEAGASEGIDLALDPRWSLSQTLEGRFYRELFDDGAGRPPQPDGLTIQGSGGLSHAFEVFRVGARLIGLYNANLSYIDALSSPSACMPGRFDKAGCRYPTEHLQSFEARAESGFDLSRSLTLELSAGLLEASASARWGQVYVQPTTRLALRVAGGRATGVLSFEHTFQPSLRLGETFRYERARLEGRLPLGPAFRERWFIVATAGYDYATRIDIANDELGESAHVYAAQAGLQWMVNDNVTALLRYELGGQSALSDVAAFTRHAVLAGVEIRYPGSRQPTQALRPTHTAPHQMNQQRWDQMFAPNPGQARPTPGAAGAGVGQPRR